MCRVAIIRGERVDTVGALREALGVEPVKEGNYVEMPEDGDCLCGVDVPETASTAGLLCWEDDCCDWEGGVMVPVEQWKWFGSAGHFICASKCRFHLCTQVGQVLVSTVGDYFANEDDEKPTTIGLSRTFETMVFKAGEKCECGCGMPEIDGCEMDFSAYQSRDEANAGHLAMCLRWAAPVASAGG